MKATNKTKTKVAKAKRVTRSREPARLNDDDAEDALDQIKDVIDGLHDSVPNDKQREELARDLIEYIQLHFRVS